MYQLNSTGDLVTPIRRQLNLIAMITKLQWSTGAKPYLDLTGTSCTDGWLVKSSAFLPYHTVYLVTDNRDLQSDEVKSVPGLSHWPMVAAWWKERLRYVGPYGELTTVVFVHISDDTGLHKVHPTWAGTYILDACVFLFPTINFALIDSVRSLWLKAVSAQTPWVLGNLILTQGANIHLG